MHASRIAGSRIALCLIAVFGWSSLVLLKPALSGAESNPNNYSCVGDVSKGTAEEGSEAQQVQYTFYCDGPITGYQLQSQIPVIGIQSPPLLTLRPAQTPLTDTFSCSGEQPGWAVNCVGATKGPYEQITGQFAIATKLCAEPRVDPLLTVTYAYLEKSVVTQAISGPFDLGRPLGCARDAQSAYTRLNPKPLAKAKAKKHASRRSRNKAEKR